MERKRDGGISKNLSQRAGLKRNGEAGGDRARGIRSFHQRGGKEASGCRNSIKGDEDNRHSLNLK